MNDVLAKNSKDCWKRQVRRFWSKESATAEAYSYSVKTFLHVSSIVEKNSAPAKTPPISTLVKRASTFTATFINCIYLFRSINSSVWTVIFKCNCTYPSQISMYCCWSFPLQDSSRVRKNQKLHCTSPTRDLFKVILDKLSSTCGKHISN